MINSGANSKWYLSGASKTPIWKIFGNQSPKRLTVGVGNAFRLSRVLSRFVRHHTARLTRRSSDEQEYQLAHRYFVPLYIARIVLHELQKYAILRDLDGLIVCGICSRTKPLVVDHEHGSDTCLWKLRDYLCHCCNRLIMPVIDRLGVDKSYTTQKGLLHSDPCLAARKLQQYFECVITDDRLNKLQNEFDQCAAEMFDIDVNQLLGRSRNERLSPVVQTLLQNIV
jgi:hypothetical protein